MFKLNILIILLIILNIDCAGDKEPIIKLGKAFDKEKIEVSEETDIFNRNEIFNYTLSQREPFNAELINLRLYQGKEYIDMIRKESFDIKIKPGTKKIGDSIPVEKIIQKYGSGDYTILFTINEYVIAKKKFVIKGNALKNMENLKKEDGEKEIMPARTEKNMPKPNTYDINETIPNNTVNPVRSDQYAPNTEQNRDDVPVKRREKINPPSPSEMMNGNK